jgi:hypothetical protein
MATAWMHRDSDASREAPKAATAGGAMSGLSTSQCLQSLQKSKSIRPSFD